MFGRWSVDLRTWPGKDPAKRTGWGRRAGATSPQLRSCGPWTGRPRGHFAAIAEKWPPPAPPEQAPAYDGSALDVDELLEHLVRGGDHARWPGSRAGR